MGKKMGQTEKVGAAHCSLALAAPKLRLGGAAWEHVLFVRQIWLCIMALLPAFFVALDKFPPLGEGSQWGPPSKVGEGIT